MPKTTKHTIRNWGRALKLQRLYDPGRKFEPMDRSGLCVRISRRGSLWQLRADFVRGLGKGSKVVRLDGSGKTLAAAKVEFARAVAMAVRDGGGE